MKKILSILLAIVCIFTTISASSTVVFANEYNISRTNVSEEIFDGYENIETTLSGKVGFNYVIKIPNTSKDLRLVFNPYNSYKDCYINKIYNLGLGWQYKLSHIQINDKEMKIYKPSGYTYNIQFSNDKYEIINYPLEHKLSLLNDMYILEEPYGVKEYFSLEGTLVKSINEFGESTEYRYNDLGLEKIIYSDGTYIKLQNSFSNKICKEEIYYVNDTKELLIGTIVVNIGENKTLKSITSSNGFNVSFDYSVYKESIELANYSIEGKYYRDIIYNNNSVSKIITHYYDDGSVEKSNYSYDEFGRISKITDGDDAETQYTYKLDSNNNLIIDTLKYFNGSLSSDTKTLNDFGQITQYSSSEGILKMKYQNNRIVEESENNFSIYYTYNDNGLVETAKFPNNEYINYTYYDDGTKQEIFTSINGKTYNYIKSNEDKMSFNLTNNSIAPYSTISVLYKIGTNIGVTNWHSAYNLSQTSFNCYTYSIGKAGEARDPGYYSKSYNNNLTTTGAKLNTEKDQEALGRKIYDSTVSEAYNSHSWKIALKVRKGDDYHFMKRSYGSSANWEFKAGWQGPVMRVLNSKTPSQITWDAYYLNPSTKKWAVSISNYYNELSAPKYMIIKD